jgi:hypothetical protein
MQHKRIHLTVLLLSGLGLTGLLAQESVNATGGNASGSGGSFSYSVGQVVYNTLTGTNGSVAQGVQQPFEISVVTAIEESKGIELSALVYPNPTTDYLNLSIQEMELSGLEYRLYDFSGKLLRSEKINDNTTIIPMNDLEPAIYLLRVINSKRDIKVFKIVKR